MNCQDDDGCNDSVEPAQVGERPTLGERRLSADEWEELMKFYGPEMAVGRPAMAAQLKERLSAGEVILDLGWDRDGYLQAHVQMVVCQYRFADALLLADQIAKGDVRDWTDLPYLDGEIDGVVCDLVLSFMPDPAFRFVLSEIRRVLRPGGWLLMRLIDGRADRWNNGLPMALHQFTMPEMQGGSLDDWYYYAEGAAEPIKQRWWRRSGMFVREMMRSRNLLHEQTIPLDQSEVPFTGGWIASNEFVVMVARRAAEA